MKGITIGASIVGLVLVGVGAVMALTNPEQSAYDDYATAELTQYLEENACSKAPSFLGNVLQTQCVELLQDNQDEIKELISESTQRQNFLILSVYKTNLSVSSLLPAYEFETIGVFRDFYTYKARQR
ncbi:MAG: DUF4359 domain-containing protein [Leptolyngbyaceae cyanobacterium RM1_406_9]|nr:DUF4359 domain-containing protein [Leptolyngbyaceae cyanobacterium RM1_406_9]